MRTYQSLAAALLAAGGYAAHADELRAYAGVVAGNAVIGPALQCATSGPTIGNGWFAGLILPTEGIASCGLVGGTDDKIGTSGPLVSTFSASGPMALVGAGSPSGNFSGTAKARADYWSLGVGVTGLALGASSATTYRQATAFASFTQTVTYNHPSLAIGTPGSTDFQFLVEGLANSLRVAPYSQQLDVNLQVRVNGRGVWDMFLATLNGDALPFVRGGSTGLPGSFASGAGSLAGSALLTTTAGFGIEWGVPFNLEVVLTGNASPCCFGASQSANFLNSATLAGIIARGPGGVVNDFTVTTLNGPSVGPGGLLPVPEPGGWALMLLGTSRLLSRARTGAFARQRRA